MKTVLSITLFFSICFTFSARAAPFEFGLEHGRSTSFLANPKYYTTSEYSSVTVRYGYVEAIQGGWVGESSGRFIGVSGAYRSSGIAFFDGTFGVVKLLNYQGNQLDGDKQFNFSLGIGYRYQDFRASVKFRHFSNSNYKGTNWGQEFKLLNISYGF